MSSSGEQGGLWTRPFTLAFIASFALNMAFHAFVHFPGQLHSLHAAESYIGVAVATMSLVGLLARPWIGKAMDGIGRRKVALTASAANTVACLLYLTIDSAGAWVFVVRGLHGVAEAAVFSVLFTIAADLVPSGRRTQGIAVFGVSGMVSVSLGALLGDAVLEIGSYGTLWATCTGLAGAGFLLLCLVPETKPDDEGVPATDFLKVLTKRELLPMWLVGAVFAMGLASYFTFLKTYSMDVGTFEVSTFFTPYAIVAIVFRIGLGWVPDRIGPKRTLFPALILVALGIWLLADSGGDPIVVGIAGVLGGIGHGYSFPIINALVVTRASPRERGSAVTLFTAVFDAGNLVGAPLFGLIADEIGHEGMFKVAAMCTLLGLGAFALADRPVRRALAS